MQTLKNKVLTFFTGNAIPAACPTLCLLPGVQLPGPAPVVEGELAEGDGGGLQPPAGALPQPGAPAGSGGCCTLARTAR